MKEQRCKRFHTVYVFESGQSEPPFFLMTNELYLVQTAHHFT